MFHGDVPCFYYHLKIPAWMHKYFAVKGVGKREFIQFMKTFGVDIADPGPSYTHLAVQVLVMGYSWACFLANAALQDVLSSSAQCISELNRMVYGSPLPMFLKIGFHSFVNKGECF